MKVNEADWNDLKDKVFLLKKRINEHTEDRKDMLKLLNLLLAIYAGKSKVGIRRLLVVVRKFLHEIEELD